MKISTTQKKAFTLIELLVVIAFFCVVLIFMVFGFFFWSGSCAVYLNNEFTFQLGFHKTVSNRDATPFPHPKYLISGPEYLPS